jgi:hypothetical protein
MRRWIIFGLVIMLAFVFIANLGGPRAWASDEQSPSLTVPTRTPKPSGTLTLAPPTATPIPPPTKPPVTRPTNTPAPVVTDTPVVVPTTSATVIAATVTPKASITATATATVVAVTSTATTVIDQPTVTATSPAEVTPTATLESSTVTTSVAAPPLGTNPNSVPVQIPASADQAGSATSNTALPSGCLLVSALVLIIAGAILLFGRRKDKAK